jgi:hypothetical protein
MISLWRARLALVLFVVALLAVAQVQRPHASTNIVWRFLVVSFDNPSTQALDALATEPAPHADLGAELREVARVGAGVSGRLAASDALGSCRSLALSSCITRSPPEAS